MIIFASAQHTLFDFSAIISDFLASGHRRLAGFGSLGVKRGSFLLAKAGSLGEERRRL